MEKVGELVEAAEVIFIQLMEVAVYYSSYHLNECRRAYMYPSRSDLAQNDESRASGLTRAGEARTWVSVSRASV